MSSYDGGKGGAGVAQWIINQVPPHRRWISLFLGNCAVTRAIRPAETQIGVEIDRDVIAAYWRDARGLITMCGDALGVLKTLQTTRQIDPRTFVYADPPYLLETRSSQRPIYAHEFATPEQHRALLARLRRLPCMVAISGYWSALYEMELSGWRSSTFTTVKRSGEAAEEWLWMNYPAPLELHDYRYLGSNFRERERIKRKKARWTARLRTMDGLERLCLMEAIAELRDPIARSDDSAGGIARSNEPGQLEALSPDRTMPAAIASNGDACRQATPEVTMLELDI